MSSTLAPEALAAPVPTIAISKTVSAAELRWRARAISLGVVVGVLALWAVASARGWVHPPFLPAPAQVVRTAISLWRDGYVGATLPEHALASLLRVAAGFGIAAAAAIPIGLVMGMNRWVKAGFDPVIEFYWPLPPLSYLPLIIIWLGIGEVAKVTLLTLAMFAPICLSVQSGVRGVPRERVHAARTLGATGWQVFTEIMLPSALPELFTGLRIAVGVGWGTLVAAELVAATSGVGFMIMQASEFLSTDIVFIGIFTIAVLAIGSSLLIRAAEQWLVPWRGRT